MLLNGSSNGVYQKDPSVIWGLNCKKAARIYYNTEIMPVSSLNNRITSVSYTICSISVTFPYCMVFTSFQMPVFLHSDRYIYIFQIE